MYLEFCVYGERTVTTTLTSVTASEKVLRPTSPSCQKFVPKMTIYCGKCEKDFKVTASAHKCLFCKKYFHVNKCSNSIIVDEKYDEATNLISVMRSKCIFQKLGQINALEKLGQKTKNEVDDQEGKLKLLTQDIASKREEISSLNERLTTGFQQTSLLTQQVATISQTLQALSDKFENSFQSSPQAIQPPADELMKSVAEHMVELQEREKRKFNILIRGVPEVLASAPESDDETKVKYNLFQRAMGIPAAQIPDNAIVSIRRVGRPSQDYPRPLIVTLDSMKTKIMILKAAPNLKRKSLENASVRHESNTLFITPDYTKQQQLQQKNLRDEVKRRRASGETVKIYRNQVIAVNNPATRPTAQDPLTQHTQRPQESASAPSTSRSHPASISPNDGRSESSN